MKRKTKCLNVKCGHKTTEDKLVEVNKIEFNVYNIGIIKYTNKDKENPWVYLVCPKCKHTHYFDYNKKTCRWLFNGYA